MKCSVLLLAFALSACQPVATSSSTTTPSVTVSTEVVTKVTDGDTVCVAPEGTTPVTTKTGRYKCIGQEIRLIGIDTPETVKPGTPVQCYGPEASARMAQLLPVGTPVTVMLDSRNGTRPDKFGRTLAYLYKGGAFVNVLMIREGYAIADPFPNTRDHEREFASAQVEAQTTHVGLWSNPTTKECKK